MSALHKNTFGSVDSIRQNCLIGIAVVNDPELVGADNLCLANVEMSYLKPS